MTSGTFEFGQAHQQFVSALQSAMTMDAVVDAFMAVADQLIHSDGHGLYRLDASTGGVESLAAVRQMPFLAAYEEYGRADDPVLDSVLSRRRPMDSSRLKDTRVWESSGARAAVAVDGFGHALQAPIIVGGTVHGTINFGRAATAAPYTESDLLTAAFASTQLGLAAERVALVEQAVQRAEMLERVLDRLPQPVVLTDLGSRVLFRNRAATAAGVHDRIAPTGAVDNLVSDAVRALRADGTRVHTGSAQPAGTDDHLVAKTYRLNGPQEAAVTLVFKAGSEQMATLPIWNVLSQRQREIVELVAQGLSNAQIAERTFISDNTVKQHLKRIFAKVDVHSRTELVRLAWARGDEQGAGPLPPDRT